MLNKQYRITKNKEFDLVLRQGYKVFSPIFIMRYCENRLGYSRFGLIVSNKVSKKASQRNLVKRRIREIVRLNFTRISPGYDIVMIVSPKIIIEGKVMSYNKIEPVLIASFKRAKLL